MQSPVHPHVCGEYGLKYNSDKRTAAVHPHVCGEYVKVLVRVPVEYRFIPTCVGNTPLPGLSLPRPTVHPHVCGEYLLACYSHVVFRGSSPRVWGIRRVFAAIQSARRFIPTCVGNTHAGGYILPRYRRFIPTCVGNTNPLPFGGGSMTVHPHVCGEYDGGHRRGLLAIGSSPRVWGILDYHSNRSGDRRFIPTCVGNTPKNDVAFSAPAVHPHVCGEYTVARSVGVVIMRFIPTCVGNTTLQTREPSPQAVHPHVCGEYARADAQATQQRRFIPTCVGNTQAARLSIRLGSVHPHVCGEYCGGYFVLVRVERFIPTCVGNTINLNLAARKQGGSSPRVWGIRSRLRGWRL